MCTITFSTPNMINLTFLDSLLEITARLFPTITFTPEVEKVTPIGEDIIIKMKARKNDKRLEGKDFKLLLLHEFNETPLLTIQGKWRETTIAMLYNYNNDSCNWIKGQQQQYIDTPQPDGEELECLARQFYPIYLNAINGKV